MLALITIQTLGMAIAVFVFVRALDSFVKKITLSMPMIFFSIFTALSVFLTGLGTLVLAVTRDWQTPSYANYAGGYFDILIAFVAATPMVLLGAILITYAYSYARVSK